MKIQFPFELANKIALELLESLGMYCTKIKVVGSIRRKKPWVGDIEMLIIPTKKLIQTSSDLFPTLVDITAQRVLELRKNSVLELREKKDGTTSNGNWVKLMRHVPSSVPLDLFFATPQTWTSALVCRTGGKTNNEELASRAKALGFRWEMNGPGFKDLTTGRIIPVRQEKEIYQFLGLPFLPPELRK